MGQAASGVLGVGLGLSNVISGARERRQAIAAANAYQRQDLNNIADGMTVSRLGADIQREDNARLSATAVDALQGGGARALVGGLGRVQANNNAVGANIAADLDAQQKEIDRVRANDAAQIRSMREARENADLAALSSQAQAGQDRKMQGFGNMVQGVGSVFGGLTAAGMLGRTAAASNGFTTTGDAVDTTSAATRSPVSAQYDPNYGTGYATPPIVTDPSYLPANYGPQNYNRFAAGNMGLFNPALIPSTNYR